MALNVPVLVRRPGRIGTFAIAALLLSASVTAFAQPTLNVAPRIAVPALASPVRAATLCVDFPTATPMAFTGWNLVDPDVGAGDLLVRIDLEPGAGGGSSTVAIPGLAGLPGVSIAQLRPDRIRFTAPLPTVSTALAALVYTSTVAQVDLLDIGIDDLQLPPLSADVRLYFDVRSGAIQSTTACMPPPDLIPASDTGVDDDDITEARTLAFLASALAPGDMATLFDDGIPVDVGIAAGSELLLGDPSPAPGLTHFYSIGINGDIEGSSAWSVAVLNGLFIDGFEDPPPP